MKHVADLLFLLKKHHDAVVSQVIDNVLEDIRLMMEINQPKFNQRRLAMVKLLGEMYVYRVVEVGIIFQELYSFISFGVDWKNPNASVIDPPDSLFRVRLCCQLLTTVGEYFTSPVVTKKLDCFLLFFQKYFWFKKSHDIFSSTKNESNYSLITTQIFFEDTIKGLRTNFQFAKSFQEASQAVDQLMAKLAPILPKRNDNDSSSPVDGNNPATDAPNSSQTVSSDLNAIPEEAEDTNDSNTDNKDEEDDEDDKEDDEDTHEDECEEDDGEEERSSSSSQGVADEKGDMTDKSTSDDPIVRGKKLVSSKEDDEFKKEFEKMIAESYASRAQETVRSHLNEVSLPVEKTSKGAKLGKTIAVSTNFKEYHENNNPDAKEALNLTVLTRTLKGNKPILKKIQVPLDTQLAISMKEKEEKERKEKLEIKKLTLEMSDRIEEYEAALESKPPSGGAGSHHAYRKKNYYSHPKGVPDADLIFGSSSTTTATGTTSNINNNTPPRNNKH